MEDKTNACHAFGADTFPRGTPGTDNQVFEAQVSLEAGRMGLGSIRQRMALGPFAETKGRPREGKPDRNYLVSLHKDPPTECLHRAPLLPLPRRIYLGYGARESDD
ncbi:MAG TPA: hypothetical protein DD706_15990 [Nitrospiraceae bacterium]|nr:hypothetical protein [Nitrospiraceae bacterium]